LRAGGPAATTASGARPEKSSIRYHEAEVRAVIARRELLAVSLLGFVTACPAASADKTVPDDLLYDRVNRSLITDRDLGTHPLRVTVKEGVVIVSGTVETEKLKKKVTKVVKKVDGVKKIVNQVEVKI
jgi:osmotically-inducible protein OsmY